MSLFAALVLCQLDYGNGTLVGLPAYTLSADSSRCRTPRRDWYSVSADLTTSRMRSSASTGCEYPKGLFSMSTFWPIRLYMAMSRSTCDSSHRSPTSRPDKDFGLQLPTSYVFLLLDCLLLDIAPSLSPVLAYGTTYRLMLPQHHLCSPLENCIFFDYHIS